MTSRADIEQLKRQIATRREQLDEMRTFFEAHRDMQLAIPEELAEQLEEQRANSIEKPDLARYAIRA